MLPSQGTTFRNDCVRSQKNRIKYPMSEGGVYLLHLIFRIRGCATDSSLQMKKNVMFLGCGEKSIRFRPALIIEEKHIDGEEAGGILESIVPTL